MLKYTDWRISKETIEQCGGKVYDVAVLESLNAWKGFGDIIPLKKKQRQNRIPKSNWCENGRTKVRIE